MIEMSCFVQKTCSMHHIVRNCVASHCWNAFVHSLFSLRIVHAASSCALHDVHYCRHTRHYIASHINYWWSSASSPTNLTCEAASV